MSIRLVDRCSGIQPQPYYRVGDTLPYCNLQCCHLYDCDKNRCTVLRYKPSGICPIVASRLIDELHELRASKDTERMNNEIS